MASILEDIMKSSSLDVKNGISETSADETSDVMSIWSSGILIDGETSILMTGEDGSGTSSDDVYGTSSTILLLGNRASVLELNTNSSSILLVLIIMVGDGVIMNALSLVKGSIELVISISVMVERLMESSSILEIVDSISNISGTSILVGITEVGSISSLSMGGVGDTNILLSTTSMSDDVIMTSLESMIDEVITTSLESMTEYDGVIISLESMTRSDDVSMASLKS